MNKQVSVNVSLIIAIALFLICMMGTVFSITDYLSLERQSNALTVLQNNVRDSDYHIDLLSKSVDENSYLRTFIEQTVRKENKLLSAWKESVSKSKRMALHTILLWLVIDVFSVRLLFLAYYKRIRK